MYLTEKELAEKLAYARYETLREAALLAQHTTAGPLLHARCSDAWQHVLSYTPRGPHGEALPTTYDAPTSYGVTEKRLAAERVG